MIDHSHDDDFCLDCWRWDPLAALRRDDDPPLDVTTSGVVFFDIIFTGLPRLPRPGEELWSAGMGSCPGGIANLATASARLGMRTSLVTGFGDDAYGAWMRSTLSGQEHIDLSASRTFTDFHSATTVSLAFDGDRGMVSHGHPLPGPLLTDVHHVPRSKAAVLDLTGDISWLDELTRRGTMVFADVGFDETGRWDPADLAGLNRCHAFTPNAVEAMSYTRTSSPRDALHRLADLVPLAIVTDGAAGSYAIDQSTGEEAHCPALRVEAIDPTGAGDVFAASCLLGTLAGWPLEVRLRLASLSSSLAVQEFGGTRRSGLGRPFGLVARHEAPRSRRRPLGRGTAGELWVHGRHRSPTCGAGRASGAGNLRHRLRRRGPRLIRSPAPSSIKPWTSGSRL